MVKLHIFSLLIRVYVYDKYLKYTLYFPQATFLWPLPHLGVMVRRIAGQDWFGVVILKASKPLLKVKSVKLRA